MSLHVCVLASGSAANCTYVASPRTRILIDAGLSGRETARRLALLGVDLRAIQAVCVTHEHEDHKAALGSLQRRHGLALYANAGTIEAIEHDERLRNLAWQVFTTGHPFQIGDLTLEPFSVPHDSYDPIGFVVCAGDLRAAVVTDMGITTGLIREKLRSCQVVVLECNHDEAMLRDAERPWSLKQRIAGRQGHLSNRQAGELIADIAGPQLQAVFLAHLSAECNRPQLALQAIREALARGGQDRVTVRLTYADRASEVVSVTGREPLTPLAPRSAARPR
jgi:phosphoribosyl 1,2-cyclic phosphodiesterase